MKQRRSFLLIESLTAASLSVLVMLACISLFFFLWRMSSRQQRDLERESQRWRRVSSLRWMLSRIQRANPTDPFFLEGNDGASPRLIFVFDHGVHLNPKLANVDLAQLYVDPREGLVLVTRSHPSRACVGQEEERASVLWPGVKSIRWKFALRPQDKDDTIGAEQDVEDNWLTAWRQEWSGLPAVIQAVIEEEDAVETVVTAIVAKDIGAIKVR